MAKTKEEPLLQYRVGNERVSAYENRIEIRHPKVLTLGLTHRTDTIFYSAIQDVDVATRSITVHMGTLRLQRIGGSKKDIRALVDIINAHR
ncbi:hypothetical protein [Bifidobacterium cuniculi]|uniref:Bacterial Pleckstrin homology domain-containing protein n=1 Tax=Bifidobacterium cuniculi TaxID=1688 RepID=A0A087B4I0_9BIFI|nr:hypothetical protein [Bifidobacterium cuniculi]KFI65930.1 hypothetical protein BCUN_0429 [Bifidobacterium cuniculi]